MLIETRRTIRPILEKVITPTALILIDDDVVKTYMNADVEFNTEAASDNVEAIWEYVKGKKVYHLAVPDASTQITMGVDEFGDSRFENLKLGEAIIVKTLAHRILAKAFVKVRCSKYPIEMFEDENDALAWFDTLRATTN